MLMSNTNQNKRIKVAYKKQSKSLALNQAITKEK